MCVCVLCVCVRERDSARARSRACLCVCLCVFVCLCVCVRMCVASWNLRLRRVTSRSADKHANGCRIKDAPNPPPTSPTFTPTLTPITPTSTPTNTISSARPRRRPCRIHARIIMHACIRAPTAPTALPVAGAGVRRPEQVCEQDAWECLLGDVVTGERGHVVTRQDGQQRCAVLCLCVDLRPCARRADEDAW